jgi:hypothetical protein
MPSFAKGPWKVVGPSKPHGVEQSRDFAIVDTRPKVIAEVFDIIGKDDAGTYIHLASAEATANLIAAAPDLYAACNLSLAALANPQAFDIEQVGRNINAALKKADGI